MSTLINFAEINNKKGLKTSYCKEHKDYSLGIALNEYVNFDNFE